MCDIKATVEKITLDPNEVLIFKISDRLNEEEVRSICDSIKVALPSGARFLVITGDVELKKIEAKEKIVC